MKKVWTGATFAIALGWAVSMSAQAGSTTGSQTSRSSRAITVTGCLQGGAGSATAGATGTSGATGAASSASRTSAQYTLTNARMSSGSSTASGSTSGASAPGTPGASAGSTPGAAAGGATAGTAGSGSAGSMAMSGSTYILEGRDTELAQHSGHQIEVTGTLAAAASSGTTDATGTTPGGAAAPSSGSGTMASAASGQRIQVTSVKMISSTCPTQ